MKPFREFVFPGRGELPILLLYDGPIADTIGHPVAGLKLVDAFEGGMGIGVLPNKDQTVQFQAEFSDTDPSVMISAAKGVRRRGKKSVWWKDPTDDL